MSTSKTQRVSIFVITIVMVVGTLGSFLVMILANKDQAKNQVEYQKAVDDYTKIQKSYQAKVDAQSAELSAKYYEQFSQYASYVSSFDFANVKSLETEDIVVGDGAEISGETPFASYYIGWDGNGRIFDQSIDTTKNSLKAPLPIADGLDKASLIKGWISGMKGMHINGVRMLTIPSDEAYGKEGQTDQTGKQTIAPNMPLRFIVMTIPMPETIQVPDMSEIMSRLSKYQQQ